MRFEIRERNGNIPDLTSGERGRELSCFVPGSYSWKQVNYGQGEGQVEIDSREWGFYYSERGISIILHDGEIELEEAKRFVNAVAEKIYSENTASVEIFLIGTD